MEWGGTQLYNKRILTHPDFLDEPQRQLGTLILPPDPPSIMNARVENYSIDEEPSVRVLVGVRGPTNDPDPPVRVTMGFLNPSIRVTVGQ